MKHFNLILCLLMCMACKMNQTGSTIEKNQIESAAKTKIINNMDTGVKDILLSAIQEFEGTYIKCSKEIYFTKSLGFGYRFEKDGKRTSGKIDDSLRLAYIDAGLKNPDFLKLLTKEYQIKIDLKRQSVSDPINTGYILTDSEVGKSLSNILTHRGFLNLGAGLANELPPDDGSDYMSEEDYINYHKEKIHLVNDTFAVYKNTDAELTLEENLNRIYFIFKKENKESANWLLDDIQICSKEEEEAFDLKLIGEFKPIVYYEAKVLDYEGRF